MKDEKIVKKAVRKTTVKKAPDSAKVAAEVFEEKLPVTAEKKTQVAAKTSTKVTAKMSTLPAEKKTKTKETQMGLSLKVYNKSGEVSGEVNLPEEVFGVKVNKTLMAQAVRVYLANQRQGTQSTKTRGEVRGSTRKIYRQKGTGKARHGGVRAPIFVGGGVAFAPKPRDHSLKMPQKMRKGALASALTQQLKKEKIVVLDVADSTGKTKELYTTLKTLSLHNKHGKADRVLFVFEGENILDRAARNIDGVTLCRANNLNTYEVLVSHHIVLIKSAIDAIAKTFEK